MVNVTNLNQTDRDIRRALRSSLRAARNNLTPTEQHTAAKQLLQVAEPLLFNSQIIAAYLPNDGEISPLRLIEAAWAQNKTVTLPVLHPFNAGTLLFVNYPPDSPMTTNRFGIPEPVLTVENIIPVHMIDTFFVPLVGFDTQGNRMGMGGGFYDRTLESLVKYQRVGYTSEKITTLPKLVGLAHSVQQLDMLPVAHWDIPMSHIITEQNYISIA